ncbi:MAG: DUF6883 domain-containing protein [Leptolyngbyaceae cyanobacterium]
MKIPEDAVIPDEKITRYLLVPKARNDKSKFLAQAGFTPDNPDDLRAAIRLLLKTSSATADGRSEYGEFYRVVGQLIGVNEMALAVVTIWLQRQVDGKFQFVTLKPLKENQ